MPIFDIFQTPTVTLQRLKQTKGRLARIICRDSIFSIDVRLSFLDFKKLPSNGMLGLGRATVERAPQHDIAIIRDGAIR